ncbi:Hypothetical predicted protein [Mytilus galloprovincialis]|nr:Hypothetical predicted protein [Mytilus galloprovincialis]
MIESNIFWSPDLTKELWCPDECYTNYYKSNDIDNCCSCKSFPQWQQTDMFSNTSYILLELEIADVKGKYSYLIVQKTLPSVHVFFGVTHQNGFLRRMPRNICDFGIVSVDFTGNRFTEIGNISCLQQLDTFILKRNKLNFVSNDTFVGLTYLRVVDLSENMITTIENNLFRNIHVLNVNFGSNSLRKLDVTNIFMPNKVVCDNIYSHNKYHIDITNEENFQLGNDSNIVCGSFTANNLSLSDNPISYICKHIETKSIGKYFPCGDYQFYGSAYNCDCNLGLFLDVTLDVVQRIYRKRADESVCNSPEPLVNISIQDVWVNDSFRHMMTCDVIDNCTKTRDCHCQCTMQPSKERIIVDCSNQNCTRFPDVVPEFKYNFDLALNLSNNNIMTMDFKDYFRRMSVLDLNDNPISVLADNFNQMGRLTEMRIQDHSLNNLPKSIQKLDPDIFRFGIKGIPCNCDNLWISEWRIYKNASENWKLYCSNYDNKTFEEMFNILKDCNNEDIVHHYLIIYAFILVVVLIVLPFMLSHFRYELAIIRRRINSARNNARIQWKYDTYVSFDDQNEGVREFVVLELVPFLERVHNYRMYVPCRDSIPGNQVEDNLISNMKISKTVLIINSKSMYDLHKSELIDNKDDGLQDIKRQARRVEYSYAWNYFTSRYLQDIAIIDFDHSNQHYFNRSKTKAMHRLGMTVDICNRKIDIKTYILKFLGRPICLPKGRGFNIW